MHKFMNVTCKLFIRSHTLLYAKAHLDFCLAYEKRMHYQRTSSVLGTYAAYVLNVRRTYSAYAQLTRSASVSVRDFMYKNGRNRDCVHDLIATQKHQNNILGQ